MDPLEIIISAVDDASEQIAAVGESMDALASDTTAASTQVDGAMTAMTASTSGWVDSTTASFNAYIESVEAAAASTGVSEGQIMADMEQWGIGAQQAADEIVAANTRISVSSDGMAADVGASSESSTGSFAALGAIGVVAFNSLTGFIGTAISQAEAWNETSAIISQELQSIGSNIPVSAMQDYAKSIQDVTLFTQQQALSAESVIAGNAQLAPQYQSLTMLAADLATKVSQFGGAASDMPAAMKIITNALQDPVAGITQLIKQAGINLPAAMVTRIENMAKGGDTAGADTLLLQALNSQIDGLAQKAADASGGALTQMENQLGALATTIGLALLPDLTKIAEAITPIIVAMANWVNEHPKLTEAILAAMVVFTALIAVMGVVGLAIILFGGAFVAVGVAIAAAVALIVGIIIDNWTLIENDTKDLISLIETVFTAGIKGIEIIWQDGWNAISTIVTDIWNVIGATVKTGVNDVISIINGFINALDAIHISLPSIAIPGTKLATPAINLGFTIPDIPMLAEGGFVTSPTLAIIGEQGPEAVVPLSSNSGFGQGQPIVINIQGGYYLDQQGANQIAQALATKINRQIRLSSSK